MFPFDIEDEEAMPEIEEEKELEEYEVDFESGKLTGRKISGKEDVKQWIHIALSIDRYHYTQYSWEYGSELRELIGKHYDEAYIMTEAKRMVEEAVMQNEKITGIRDFKCSMKCSTLTMSFTAETIYGEIEVSENV